MNEILRLLSFPITVVIAWLVSRRHPEVARRVARCLSIFAAMIFLVIVASGWMRSEAVTSSVHKWSGHALVIAIWLSVPFSAGVVLQRKLRLRPAIAIAQIVVLLLLLGLVLLASMTGYLAPSQIEDIEQETKNRFNVLHLFALPFLIATLLCAWCWLFRPRTGCSAEQAVGQAPNGSS